MEQPVRNKLAGAEIKKSGRGQYERKERGSYQKNKLDKKITVKHYLNTKINANYFPKEKPLYPLYIQVTFNRRTTYRKSDTHFNFESEEHFLSSLNNEEIVRDLNREKRFVEYYLGKKFIDSFASQEITFQGNAESADFWIKHFTSQYEYDYSYQSNIISICIQKALAVEIMKVAVDLTIERVKNNQTSVNWGQDDTIWGQEDETGFDYGLYKIFQKEFMYNYRPIFDLMTGMKQSSALEQLNFYGSIEPKFLELKEKYQSDIWLFSTYYDNLIYKKYGTSPLCSLGFTILDIMDDTFSNIFLDFYSVSQTQSTAIIEDIKKLILIGSYDFNFGKYMDGAISEIILFEKSGKNIY